MNNLLASFKDGWWLVVIAAICILVIIVSWLFFDLLISIVWLSLLVKILISVLFGGGAILSIFILLFAPESM